uniref:Uncharacterized protein n=1 Tax=Vespula pensylvanica TaxID=30213 RepID=A0A834PGQ9_VESPE|nr:hypothetical protein H0235_001810 [Vespula pensylvanica]
MKHGYDRHLERLNAIHKGTPGTTLRSSRMSNDVGIAERTHKREPPTIYSIHFNVKRNSINDESPGTNKTKEDNEYSSLLGLSRHSSWSGALFVESFQEEPREDRIGCGVRSFGPVKARPVAARP